jgi:dolichol kinase
VIGANPVLVQQTPLRAEMIRKAIHAAVALTPVAYAFSWISRSALIGALLVASGVALAIELLRRVVPRMRVYFNSVFGMLLRPRERSHITGATWLALSCLVAVVLLPRQAAIAALWCATAGDTAAAVVGRTLGAKGRGPKTFVGSAAFFAVAVVGAIYLAGFPPLRAVTIALIAMVAERYAGRIDDNVVVAVASGAIAWGLS